MADTPTNGNNKVTPTLVQTRTVQRNPFVPDSVEPRPDARVAAHADPTKEYVPSGVTGYYPFLRALPPYIDDISQQFGLVVYENMMRDPVVYASERVFTLAMLAHGYEIVPSLASTESDYDVAVRMCDFVKQNIENLETSYDVILEQQLNAFEYGCAIAEQIYYVDDGKLFLKDIRDKPLINAIFVVDSYNNTIGIMTQRFPGQVYPAGSYIPIDFSLITQGQNAVEDERNARGEFDLSKRIPGFLPRYLFSILTNEMRYNDERGKSGLRAAYSAWWFKQQVIAEYLSWLSKFASPSLVGTTAQGAIGQTLVDKNLEPLLDANGNPLTKTPEEVMSEALAAFQNGSALAVPFGSTVEPIQAQGDGAGFAKALNWANAEMVRGITYQYLATSEGEHQSRASSETHQDILSLGILRRKRWLANQQRREVFLPLLRYNFDLSGKKIKRYVPKLSLGMGNGFPLTASDIASLAGKYPIDPSQHLGIDEMIGLPRRETIMVNGAPMTPTEIQKKKEQQEQQQAAQAQQNEFGAMKADWSNGHSAQPLVITPPAMTINLPEAKTPEMNVHLDAPIQLPDSFAQAIRPNVMIQMPPQQAQRAPQVNVKVNPTPIVVRNNVKVPQGKPADVVVHNAVNVPEQAAPTVNIAMPRESEEVLNIERDMDNRIKRVFKKIVWGDAKRT